MKCNRKYAAGLLGLAMVLGSASMFSGSRSGTAVAQTAGAGASAAQAGSLPIDRLVVLTCRQAWQMGGRNEDGFFAIVKQLAELSAQNRGVTLPDDKDAGARAGQWIRTQALKDPDQLLYAVVDHAVLYSINKGRTAAAGTSAATRAPSK